MIFGSKDVPEKTVIIGYGIHSVPLSQFQYKDAFLPVYEIPTPR